MVEGKGGEKTREKLINSWLIIRNSWALLVLRFSGTGEQCAPTEEFTALSSEVLLSLAGWFWSFGKWKQTGGVLKHFSSAADIRSRPSKYLSSKPTISHINCLHKFRTENFLKVSYSVQDRQLYRNILQYLQFSKSLQNQKWSFTVLYISSVFIT